MYPLTTSQRNIWNLCRFYEGTGISNNCGAIFFEELCDHRILNRSINRLLRLQEGLRLRFREESGEPVQYIADDAWTDHPEISFASEAELETFARELAAKPFSVDGGPMVSFHIFDLPRCSGVLLCVSHLIADAWAVSIIAHEVYTSYHQFSQNAPVDDREWTIAPILEAEKAYLSSPRFEKDRAYWSQRYTVRPEPASIRPGTVSTGVESRRLRTALSPGLSAAIDGFYSRRNISQAVLIEAAVAAYLHALNPTLPEITLGALTLNRSGPEQKHTVANCISTMPLTIPVSPDSTVTDLCKEITRQHVQLFRHQKYPYRAIIQNLREQFGFDGNLYEVLVSFQNAKSNTGARTCWYGNGFCEVPLELHIDNRDSSNHYTVNIDYQTSLFRNEEEVRLLFGRLVHILEQILLDPERKLSALSILPDGEQRRMIHNFNNTRINYPRDKTIPELFAIQAAATPEKTALIFHDRAFTFRELDEISDSLARPLVERGVGPGTIVPIVSKRSWHIVAAMLGILKAGGAFMHVDVTHPAERLDHMFQVAQADFALVYGYRQSLSLNALDLEQFPFENKTVPLPCRSRPEDLCYVVFTSGSTGKPKGLMISHRNAVNYCHPCRLNVLGRNFSGTDHTILAATTTAFDIAVTETLLPLLTGMTICLADDTEAVSQRGVAKLCEAHGVDIIQTTPTKMRLYTADRSDLGYLKHLSSIILGGETLPGDLFRELRNWTGARIFNDYGPAETTVWSTIKEMTDEEITIGTPIANTQVYILDERQQLLPIGAAGELCISGDGVGMGYLNRPDLTAERFLPDPFRPGQTMYRTGDLARWRTDGELECLGRIDTQVKIRGLRIELGEIESVMSSFPDIGLCAATDKRDENGRQYLAGYYTADHSLDGDALRRHLNSQLPKYMVPHFLIQLDAMPLTVSGKTDRKNLPTPEFHAQVREYEAPETEMEVLLCGILGTLLETEVGVTDDFFALGGDSLCAIEYVAHAHNNGIELALQDVFDHPTVRELSRYLSGSYVRKAVYDPSDFVKYRPLLKHNRIDPGFLPRKRSLGNLFLTGATGFLGAHILDSYLREEAGTAWCLVRGGESRLRDILRYYFGDAYEREFGRRIRCVEGDITHPELSADLPVDVQTIIHTAATVKHYGPWEYFETVNVRGTEHVIRYARHIGAELLHISTISVSGNSLVDAFDVLRVEEAIDFTEKDLFVSQPLDNVYIRSKFEAERTVLDAAQGGLSARIIRIGNLTNRLRDMKFQPNYRSNAFLGRVRAALSIGALPDYLMPLYAEFSPIDQTAEGVIRIGQYAQNQTVFHLNSHENLYFDRMVELLNELGSPMEVLPGDEFGALLQNLGRNPKTAFIYEALQNDLDEEGRLVYDSNIHIRNDFTVWFLEQVGFHWAKIDRDYVQRYLTYFRDLGYFPAPTA